MARLRKKIYSQQFYNFFLPLLNLLSVLPFRGRFVVRGFGAHISSWSWGLFCVRGCHRMRGCTGVRSGVRDFLPCLTAECWDVPGCYPYGFGGASSERRTSVAQEISNN